jgi:ferrous iron transport protein B
VSRDPSTELHPGTLGSGTATRRDEPLVIGLAGQPNVGKSTIFNLLTGLNQRVGHWPGKTVERKEGTFTRGVTRFRIIDLPGTYSLTANSTEERVARDFILHEQPDVVVLIANASALERNLYLLAELLVLPVRVVLGLNMVDIAEREGFGVEAHVLEAALRLPVVPLVATRNEGISQLVAAAERIAREPAFEPFRPEIGEPHQPVLAEVHALVRGHIPEPYPAEWVALKLLEGDKEVTRNARAWLPPGVWERVEARLEEHEDAILDIASGRYRWIGRLVRAAVDHPRLGQVSVTDRLDRAAVHPVWGLGFLLASFGLVFWLTYTVAAPVQNWLDIFVVEQLRQWLHETLAGGPAWLVSLIADGILRGAGIVVTFVPILLVFFAAIALLEDTGYLARAAYVMDRFMHRMGLHGKSFLPLFLGFGCNVPAVMGTRVIESRAARLLTILLAPMVPCAARLAVLALLAPAFFGGAATLVAWGLVSLNILVLAVMGVALNLTLFRGTRTAFIMELPLYHLPNPRTIGLFVWNNIQEFLRKAGSVIVLVSVVVWALSSFPGPGIEQSYMAKFGRMVAPFGDLMGMDWRLLVALLTSFIAKENAIATLGILYGTGEEAVGLAATMMGVVTPASALSFLVVTMLFIPCAATMAVIRQETGSWRWTLFSVGLLLVIAVSAGILVFRLASWMGLGL